MTAAAHPVRPQLPRLSPFAVDVLAGLATNPKRLPAKYFYDETGSRPFELPAPIRAGPRLGFFPGSTIGNLEPHEVTAFRCAARRALGRHPFVIGVDLIKDPEVLYAAYNDRQGIT